MAPPAPAPLERATAANPTWSGDSELMDRGGIFHGLAAGQVF